MKKILSIVLTLVLTAALFTGCGCTNQNRPEASTPTGMTEPIQTTIPTLPSTAPTTRPTVPTTEESTLMTEYPATVPGTTETTAESSNAARDIR